jgi:5-methylcytosine-specific restriction endonuclease McrA
MAKIAECGTRSGYNRHRRLKEKACAPCTAANSKNSLASYRKDPAKAAEINKKYYQNNKDLILEKHKKYYNSNKEKVLKRHKSYYANNMDVYRRAKARRRAQERNNGFEKYTLNQVLDMYGTLCHICKEEVDMLAPRGVGKPGWEKGLHIDHIIPISKGGSDTLSNVRPAHGICNITKNTKILEETIC